MRRLVILVAALALLTTACKIEMNAEFTINADKSGSVTVEIGFDEELLEIAEASGQSADDMLADFDIGDVPGTEVSTERRGDMTFTVIKVPIDDITAAENLGGEMGAGLTEGFEVTFTDDLVTVRGSVPLDEALVGEDMSGLSPEMLAEFFAINIRITMPGMILDHNATSQNGNTLTWAGDLTSGTIDIFAESNPNANNLITLLATAGEIALSTEFVVNADKSGEVIFEIGFDDEVSQLAETVGASPTDVLGNLELEDIADLEKTTDQRGELSFETFTMPIEDFTSNRGLGVGDNVDRWLAENLEISFAENRVIFRSGSGLVDAFDLNGSDVQATAGVSPSSPVVNIRVTMPGKILDHNATSQSGNTLTWAVDLTSGTLDIFAESNPNASDGSSSVLLYVVIGAAVVLAALLLWMFMRKRGGSVPTAKSGAMPPGTPAGETPPPTPPLWE